MAKEPKVEPAKGKFNSEGVGKLLKIFRYVLPYKGWFALGMLFMFLSTLTSLCFPYLIGNLIDTNVSGTKMDFLDRFFSVDKLGITEVVTALVIILILQGLFSFLRVVMLAFVSENTMADIRTDLYDTMIGLPITFFEKNRVGDLTSRITADVTQLQDTLSWTLAEFFKQIFTLVIGIAIIFVLSPRLSLFMLATVPVLVVLAMFFGRYIKRLSRKTQDALAEANVVAEETLANVQIVKSFTNESFESTRYKSGIRKLVKFAIRSAFFRGGFISFFIYGIFGGIILVLWQGMKLVELGVDNGGMSIGALTSFVLFTIYIGASLGGFGNLFAKIQQAIGASDRVREILGEKPEVEVASISDKSAELSGGIVFKDVHFAYPTRDDIPVLKGLNIDVPEGNRIALVGSSGAGKSTVVQLLMRFYQINSGSISIGGKNVQDFDLSELRRNIGIVPQEVLLFGGTIEENIRYGNPNASAEEVRRAAEQANALEFINSFPEKLETIVGERGIKLSGGQRQRIAIARAILKNPSILILDEATSSLDSESEMLVQQALNKLMEGRTSIVIAHRLSTIRDVDNIFVLDKGTVAESGSHLELSTRSSSMYAKFLELQTEWGEA